MSVCREDQLYMLGISQHDVAPELKRLTFHTTRGDFDALAHCRPGLFRAAVVLGDPDASADGPGGIFPDLATDLLDWNIGSLQMNYRSPGDCVQSAIDVLLAVQYLDDEGIRDVVLVGWSFGGAVAVSAGTLARSVKGIAAISTLAVPDSCLRHLRSKSLLLLHGDADTVSPIEVSKRVYFRSGEPRKLVIYSGVGHDYEEAQDQLRSDIRRWVIRTLRPTASNLACGKARNSQLLA